MQSNTILQSVHRFSTGLSSSGYKYRNYARAPALSSILTYTISNYKQLISYNIGSYVPAQHDQSNTFNVPPTLRQIRCHATTHLLLVNFSFSKLFSALWLTVNSVTSEAVMQTTTSFSQLSEALHLLSERLSYSYCVMHFVIFLRKRQRDGS